MISFFRRKFGYPEVSGAAAATSETATESSGDPPSEVESKSTDDSSKSPSMAMRLTIASFRKKFPNIKGVRTDIVHKWYQEGVMETKSTTGDMAAPTNKRVLVMVDSRPEEEYKVSHIPGCVRIEHTIEDDNNLISLIDSTVKEEEKHLPKTVVMYCSLGYRSCVLAGKLAKAINAQGASASGFNNVEIYNMEGGLFKWAMDGLPLVNKTGKPTKFVHPYSPVFAQLLERSRRKYEANDED